MSDAFGAKAARASRSDASAPLSSERRRGRLDEASRSRASSAGTSVSAMREDLPEPETPVTATRRPRGKLAVRSRRLFVEACASVMRGVEASTARRLRETRRLPERKSAVRVFAASAPRAVPS